MEGDDEMSEKDSLQIHVNRWYRWSHKGQKLWSLCHHSFLFGSVVMGLLAAALLKLLPDEVRWDLMGIAWSKDNIAALLSLSAAVLAGIAATGGFERKWRINRLSRSKIEMLMIDMEAPDVDVRAVREALKKVIKEHDAGIVGSNNPAEP